MGGVQVVKVCKDCKSPTRKAIYPGPRCTTCHRARKKIVRDRSHELHLFRTYGLLTGQYAAILSHQGGVCAICLVAKGNVKRLAVDHDHKTGLVRGVICGPCNQILGRVRDDVEMLQRAIDYLTTPPASEVLNSWSDR